MRKGRGVYLLRPTRPSSLPCAGAVVYYDGQMNDTRFNVLVALTAMQRGAVGANYVEVRG